MKDDFLYQFQKPPRKQFAADLYKRISQPMLNKPALRRRLIYTFTALLVALIGTLSISPAARAMAADFLRRIRKHLSDDLLKLALKFKGPDRLALVTDCSRALDMPDGQIYLIGPLDGGEPLLKHDGVGMLPDLSALASSVEGMDHMIRTFLAATGRPLWEVIRMASLTPARIAGRESELGSLERGKFADVLVLDRALRVKRVFVGGEEFSTRKAKGGAR